MSSPVAAPPPPLLETLGTPTPTSILSSLPPTVTNSTTTTTTRTALPDYVQTLTVRDANGQVRELVFPKGLDLDRPKRARTTFTSDQLAALEREFRRNQYLVGRERSLLAARLGLSETQVKVWYQNRRTKHKRDREREHEAPMTILPSTLSSSTTLPPISRPLLPPMPPNQPPVNTPLFTFPAVPSSTPHPVTTSSIHSIPSKMCQTSPEITSSTPPTTVTLTSFTPGQTVTCTRTGQIGREGTEEQETQGGRGATPPISIKPPSPSRLSRSISGLDYHFGLSGMGGPMGGVTKADFSSTAHALEMSFSKSLPSLLGTFHSVPPPVSPSAFRPLFQRPLHHHPLALQHHALARSHPTWLP